MTKYIAAVLTVLLVVTFFGFFDVRVYGGALPEKVTRLTRAGINRCHQQAADEFGWDEEDERRRQAAAKMNQFANEMLQTEDEYADHPRVAVADALGLTTEPVPFDIKFVPVSRVLSVEYIKANCLEAHAEWTIEQWEYDVPSIRIRRR